MERAASGALHLFEPGMRKHPRSTLALAIVGEHAIFLDRDRDRYFGLADDANRTILKLIGGGEIDPSSRRILSEMIGCSADIETLRALIISPRATIREWIGPKVQMAPSWRDRIAVVGHWLIISSILRVRGLDAALSQVAHAPRHASSTETDLDRVIVAHAWLDRHVTATDACLARSLSLARYARSSGCAVAVMIGVKTDPFEAHCWVQSGNYVLNDTVDRVAAFTPIVVLP